ncbi:MAG: S1C family serine protease, partial [Chloroflexota bacterium]
MNSNLLAFSDELVNVVAAAEHGIVRINARRRLPSSGVFWGADGGILTAEHVLEFEEGITVGLPDGRELGAVVAGRDPGSDIALLKVDATGLSALAPAEPAQMKIGTLVLALGRPYGSGVTASVGIISQRTGPWRTWRGGVLDSLLLSDVAMYPGFSGGALVDAAGRLVGLNTSLLVRGAAAAVPAQTLAKVAEMLATHGRVRRGYLGVSSHPVPL